MNNFKLHSGCRFSAFTLAEMMIVLLIMTIILAVMAPVVTTRMRNGGDGGGNVVSPWLWTNEDQRRDAYLASKEINRTRAAIGFGKNNIPNDANGQARLLLNTSDNVRNHIGFYDKGSYIGTIAIDHDTSNLLFGDFDAGVNLGASNIIMALFNNHEGANDKHNTAIGYKVLSHLNSADANNLNKNVAMGSESLSSLANGARNVAIGNEALRSLSIRNQNVAIGYRALTALAQGSHNVAIGSQANHEVVDIAHYYSGSCPAIPASNCDLLDTIALGGMTRANRSWSMAIGKFATAEGQRAIAIGASNSGRTEAANALEDDSIAIGTDSAAFEINSVAIGSGAEAYEKCVVLGYKAKGGAPDGFNGTTGNNNSVAIGNLAEARYMRSLAIGSSAKAQGEQAFAMGYQANATKNSATAIGNQSKAYRTNSIAIGTGALAGTNIDDSSNPILRNPIAIGVNAKAYSGRSLAIGTDAIASTEAKANTGDGALAIGYDSVADSQESIAMGIHAKVITKSGITEGTKGARYSAAIGWKAVTMQPNTITLGYEKSEYFKAGWNSDHTISPIVIVPGALEIRGKYKDNNLNTPPSIKVVAGDVEVVDGIVKSNGTVLTSDSRQKHIGTESKAGLEKVKQLKPFNYTFKNDKDKTPRVGVIAQDLQKVFPDAVSKDSKGFLSIRMEDMFYAVVNAVKELDQRLARLEASVVDILRSVKENKDTIKQLQKDNDKLKKENAELKARLDRIEAKLK